MRNHGIIPFRMPYILKNVIQKAVYRGEVYDKSSLLFVKKP